jgi:ankyrin repeat protein
MGIDLDCVDAKGGSSLHWACYLGNEDCLNYLVCRTKNINLQD